MYLAACSAADAAQVLNEQRFLVDLIVESDRDFLQTFWGHLEGTLIIAGLNPPVLVGLPAAPNFPYSVCD